MAFARFLIAGDCNRSAASAKPHVSVGILGEYRQRGDFYAFIDKS